jgi:hypothetical protein
MAGIAGALNSYAERYSLSCTQRFRCSFDEAVEALRRLSAAGFTGQVTFHLGQGGFSEAVIIEPLASFEKST